MDAGKAQQAAAVQNSLLSELARRLNDNTRRIRLLEEQLENINSRVNKMEQSVMEATQEMNRSIQGFSEGADEMRDKIANISVDIQKINKHMQGLVNRREIKELQEYVDLLEPLTSKFATKKDVEDIVRKTLGETE